GQPVPLYRISLGMAYELAGSQESAKGEYVAALRLSPSVLSSHFFSDLSKRSPGLASACVADAIASLEQESSQKPNAIVDARLGGLYLQRDPQRAASLLSTASEKLPSLSRAWTNQAYLAELNGDSAGAKVDYQRAIFLDSSDYVPLVGLARLFELENDYRDALDCYTLSMAKWQTTISVHAYRSTRIYRTKAVLRNDLVPSWLLHYTEPAFDWTGVCLRVSQLYARSGNLTEAERYRSLSNMIVH
ncbi:MAG: tetratricopeptide repeat protein, partial [Blastocatellia bacterium]